MFLRELQKIIAFICGFYKNYLSFSIPNNQNAYAEKGTTRVYSPGDQSA